MELYTVTQVADLLGVHEKTIRRYINNGRLVAKKIGGQWRIEQADYERLIAKGTCCMRELDPDEVGSDDFCVFMDSDFFTSEATVQICTIVDHFTEDEDLAIATLEKLKSAAYDYLVRGDQVKVEFQHIEPENKYRYVVWAEPRHISTFAAILSQLGK